METRLESKAAGAQPGGFLPHTIPPSWARAVTWVLSINLGYLQPWREPFPSGNTLCVPEVRTGADPWHRDRWEAGTSLGPSPPGSFLPAPTIHSRDGKSLATAQSSGGFALAGIFAAISGKAISPESGVTLQSLAGFGGLRCGSESPRAHLSSPAMGIVRTGMRMGWFLFVSLKAHQAALGTQGHSQGQGHCHKISGNSEETPGTEIPGSETLTSVPPVEMAFSAQPGHQRGMGSHILGS